MLDIELVDDSNLLAALLAKIFENLREPTLKFIPGKPTFPLLKCFLFVELCSSALGSTWVCEKTTFVL